MCACVFCCIVFANEIDRATMTCEDMETSTQRQAQYYTRKTFRCSFVRGGRSWRDAGHFAFTWRTECHSWTLGKVRLATSAVLITGKGEATYTEVSGLVARVSPLYCSYSRYTAAMRCGSAGSKSGCSSRRAIAAAAPTWSGLDTSLKRLALGESHVGGEPHVSS